MTNSSFCFATNRSKHICLSLPRVLLALMQGTWFECHFGGNSQAGVTPIRQNTLPLRVFAFPYRGLSVRSKLWEWKYRLKGIKQWAKKRKYSQDQKCPHLQISTSRAVASRPTWKQATVVQFNQNRWEERKQCVLRQSSIAVDSEQFEHSISWPSSSRKWKKKRKKCIVLSIKIWVWRAFPSI